MNHQPGVGGKIQWVCWSKESGNSVEGKYLNNVLKYNYNKEEQAYSVNVYFNLSPPLF